LNLPLALLRGFSPSGHSENPNNYVRNLQEKLDEIHQDVKNRMEMKSNKFKERYGTKIRDFFRTWSKSPAYNPRRKKGKTSKLQRD